MDVLSSLGGSESSYNGAVRTENRREEELYLEAEILADKLLGLDYDDRDDYCYATDAAGSKRRVEPSLLRAELSAIWRAAAVAASGALIGVPIALLLARILSSDAMQAAISSIQSSVTPYLIPTASMIASSAKGYALQAQAVLHSMPYALRHLNRIKVRPLPILYKLVRKCIILEAWRHIWVRVYRLTRYLWRGTLKSAKAA